MATLKNFALDGHPEMADPASQQAVLEEFKALGGETSALWRALWFGLAGDLALLRREREAANTPEVTKADLRRLDQAVKGIEAVLAHTRQPLIRRGATEALIALSRTRHRVAMEGELFRPEALAARRRATAKLTRKQVHRQIPAANHPAGSKEDGHLRGIHKVFIREVIRRAYLVIVRAVADEELGPAARRVTMPASEPISLKVVSQRANRLTARVVLAFYPSWGKHVDQSLVSETMKTYRKTRRKAQARRTVTSARRKASN